MSFPGNQPNEPPKYVYSVAFCQPAGIGLGYYLVEEREIVESADTWVVVGYHDAPGFVKLNRLELDLDGMTVVGDRIFYSTHERALRFVDRCKDTMDEPRTRTF